MSTPPPRVTVCCCTYRRPEGLRALLDGLAAQRFEAIDAPKLDVVIVDNEGSESARAACEDFRARSALPLSYRHEPQVGISYARNACLEQLSADSDFFAMIDDDEVPEPGWLESLLVAQRATGADAVQGRVVPEFPEDAPSWVRGLGLFGWPLREPGSPSPERKDLQPLDLAATNNVLVRTGAVRALGLRFDPRLAHSGGEDTVFFGTLQEEGGRIVYAERARAHERVPAERARLSYLLRVEFRKGFDRLRLKLFARQKPRSLWKRLRVRARIGRQGLAWLGTGLLSLPASVAAGSAFRERAADGLLCLARGLGMLASALGVRYQHYR